MTDYLPEKVKVEEYMLQMSDGVSLKVIDFTPESDWSDKPFIIFIAGWISLIDGWRDVLKELTPHYRTFYVESREKKSSVIPPKTKVSFTMKRMKKDIEETIKQLIPENKKFVLAGSSLGASAILEYCASGKYKPECAILVGPNDEFRFPKILGTIIPMVHPALYFAVKPIIKWYLKNFRLDKKNEKEQIAKYFKTLDTADPYKLKANALALKNYSIINKISNITTPCLIFGATTDKLHNREHLKKIIDIIPEVQYIELSSNRDTHSEKAGRIMIDYLEKRKYRNFSEN
ncbi:MAG TPA: alpha/beta hydrolase [Spirochaetota bacterium]|nr:alpha/beta hydrolase [Spirochaetota bacterium]HOK92468.1 alpha/beta hydrolase [Spirochaetota bacterium]